MTSPCNRSFNWMSMKKVKGQKSDLVDKALESISEVMSSVASLETEHPQFMEVRCYLYRTSPVIMELQMIEDAPPFATEVLQILSAKVDLARDLITKFSSKGKPIIKDDELAFVSEQLEEVIRTIGRVLSSVPLSCFADNKYVKITVKSLSRELVNVCFHTNGTGNCNADERRLQLPYAEQTEMKQVVTNPVPSSSDHEENRSHSSPSGSMPRLGDFLQGVDYGSWGSTSRSFGASSQFSDYSEPLYDTFFCPLTKKIMDDPVTIESGITFERKAIAEWFEKFQDSTEIPACPATGIKLQSRALNRNIALKTTIEEWKRRNEAKKIKVARSALSLASSKSMVLGAMKDLCILSQRRRYNMKDIHRLGITKIVTSFLEHTEMAVRTEALKLLCLLAEEHEGKAIIASTQAIERATEMLSSNNSLERRASVAFLLELSKSQLLLERIGSTPGCILMLVTMKYNQASDAFVAEKAGIVLKNLEKDPSNIKSMAEYGFLEPLLDHLVAGSEDVQVKMARYLSELILEDGMKSYVAGKASKALMKMVSSEQSNTQGAAFAALVQISSHHQNNKILVDARVVPVLMEALFTFGIHSKTTDHFMEEASAILANIVESDIDLEKIQVNKHGHTMTSHYAIYNFAYMLRRCKSNKLSINLTKILLSMANLPKLMPTVISVVKETELSYTLVVFLSNREEELTTASAKLLIQLSSFIGHTVAETLCKTQGQPEGLIKNYDIDRITEKHAVSVNLIAKLPHQNLTLNLALLHQNAVPILLRRMQDILRDQPRRTSHAKWYLEGLVGILVRFTATLYDQEILSMARGENLPSVFTELLIMTSGSNEVQRLAAVGLEKLSCQSVHLSRPPEVRTPSRTGFLSKSFTFISRERKRSHQRVKLCPVHRGACSSSTTFCLLESRAVERLLGCLEHENAEVVEAALSAISTLLDEKVDVEKSVRVLSEADAMRHVLGVLRQHREERVWQKSFWVIERFLISGGDSSVNDLSCDRSLPSTLVTAVHRGSSSTKRLAENILRYLNRTPHSSNMII